MLHRLLAALALAAGTVLLGIGGIVPTPATSAAVVAPASSFFLDDLTAT